MIILDNNETDLFCPKCGKYYHFNQLISAGKTSGDVCRDNVCAICCSSQLKVAEPYRIVKICNNCGERYSATPEFFKGYSKCSQCNSNLETLHKLKESTNFIINGCWNGKPRGPVIREKNEQLKRKHSGMEKDGQSLRQKINEQTLKLFGKSEK